LLRQASSSESLIQEKRGMVFVVGPYEATDLTDAQIAEQCKMYIAAVRIAAKYGYGSH
jgi:hypothetical protein